MPNKVNAPAVSQLAGEIAEQVFAYRGVCSHGKTRAMSVDRPEYRKDVAKDIAQWIRWGLNIERVTGGRSAQVEHELPCVR